MRNCRDPASIKISSESALIESNQDSKTIAQSETASAGAATYQQACAVCHDAGIGDAPIPGDPSAWSDRLAQGRDALVLSALDGKGIMPPKGGQTWLADDAVAVAVDFMIEQSTQ